ncbi:MAG TPA: tetratricopeptide repeat protein, partial [Thioploca sp.]|nr:tetratricopeptide repeat protein [Thioploca sp.]
SNLGQYPKALDYFKQALAIAKEIGDKRGIGNNLTNIGVVYENFGEYQKAKEAFQESMAIHIAIGSGELWKTQRGLASAEAKLNQFDAAIKHYEQTIDNIEKICGQITKEHKTSFMQDKLIIYDKLIALLQSLHQKQPEKGYDRSAIEIFERKQGRVFFE